MLPRRAIAEGCPQTVECLRMFAVTGSISDRAKVAKVDSAARARTRERLEPARLIRLNMAMGAKRGFARRGIGELKAQTGCCRTEKSEGTRRSDYAASHFLAFSSFALGGFGGLVLG